MSFCDEEHLSEPRLKSNQPKLEGLSSSGSRHPPEHMALMCLSLGLRHVNAGARQPPCFDGTAAASSDNCIFCSQLLGVLRLPPKSLCFKRNIFVPFISLPVGTYDKLWKRLRHTRSPLMAAAVDGSHSQNAHVKITVKPCIRNTSDICKPAFIPNPSF